MAFISFVIFEEKKNRAFHRKFPQLNKITFRNSTTEVRDSIEQLKYLLAKLPKRADHGSVRYALDKHRLRYYRFSLNWYVLNTLPYLEESSHLHDYKIAEPNIDSWKTYVSDNLYPFDTLSLSESKRFIQLIKFLDRNSLNAGNLERGVITFVYNDSLSLSNNAGSRTITLDTTGFYGKEAFDIIDRKDGFYLLRRRD